MSPTPIVSLSLPKLQPATNHVAYKQQRFVAFGTSQGRGQSGGQRWCRHHTVQSHYSNALWETFESMGLFVLPLGRTGGGVVGVHDQAYPHPPITLLQETHSWPGILQIWPLPRNNRNRKWDDFCGDGQIGHVLWILG